jgi:hypothetical protein
MNSASVSTYKEFLMDSWPCSNPLMTFQCLSGEHRESFPKKRLKHEAKSMVIN